MGIERMITSVNISDQACARYIIVVSMQAPGVALKPVQFSEMGKHCRRFVAKKAIVHVMIRPIMTHEMTEKVFVLKILARRSSSLVMLLWNDYGLLPSIEKNYSKFRKSERDRLCQL